MAFVNLNDHMTVFVLNGSDAAFVSLNDLMTGFVKRLINCVHW